MCPLSGVERFPLHRGFLCTNFNGRVIGTRNNVHYREVYVRYRECPLIEVALYMVIHVYLHVCVHVCVCVLAIDDLVYHLGQNT